MSSLIPLLRISHDAAVESGASKVHVTMWIQQRRCVSSFQGDCHIYETDIDRLKVRASRAAKTGSASLCNCVGMQSSPEAAAQVGQLATARAEAATEAVSAKPGETCVVLAPEATGALVHEIVGHALEGDVARGSRLWARRNQRVTNTEINVADDPADPSAWVRAARDEEGALSRRAELISRGTVVGVISDRGSAAALEVESNGHCRRGIFSRSPAPRMWHTVMSAGPDPADQILADTLEGIVVTSIDSADAVPGQGRFSLHVAHANEIRNGRRGRALANFTVLGDLSSFGDIDAVGDDPAVHMAMCGRGGYLLPVSYAAPTVRFPRLAMRGQR